MVIDDIRVVLAAEEVVSAAAIRTPNPISISGTTNATAPARPTTTPLSCLQT